MTLNHQEPDRIPYDLAGTSVTGIVRKAYVRAMEYRGLPPESEEKDIDPIQQIVTPSEEMLKVLGSDVRRIGARRIPDFENRLNKQGSIKEVTDMFGCLWKMDESKDIYFNQYSFPLKSYPLLRDGLKYYFLSNKNLESGFILNNLSEQIRNVGDSGIIADRNCAGLTELSLRIRGYEEWFLDTVVDPSGVETLLDILIEFKTAYWDFIIDWLIKNNLQERISVISECDDLGTQVSTILDPDYLRTTVIPRFGRLWGYLKKRIPGVKIFMHTCGAIRSLLPDLIEAGMDIYNPVQFTAAGMDLKELKRDFGKDLTFWGGGVDTQATLRSGTPSEVRDEVRRNIDILAPGGGFVFSTVHNIQEDIPPENFWAMWDTMMEYRKY